MADEETPSAPAGSSDGAKMVKATAGIGAFVALGSAVSGLVTRMFLAHHFGAGAENNAYQYVYKLTQGIYRSWDKLIRPVFLPVLAEERERVGEKDSWRFVNSFFSIQALILAVITAGLILAAPWIIRLLTQFKDADADLAARYLAVIAPSVLLLSLAVTGYLLLNSYKRFQLAAFGDTVLWKLGPMTTLLLLYWFFGIYALVAGVAVSAAAKLALYAWGLRRELRNFRWQLDLSSPAMKRVGWLILPLSVGVALAFVRDIIESWFMSGVQGGQAVTVVGNSRTAVDLPIQVLPVALSVAIFPFLSDYVAKNEHEKIFDILGKALRIILLVFLPLTVAMVVLAHPLMSALFGSGKYVDQVGPTASALQWYALGYVFFGLEIVMLQFFYASKDTITPTWTGILTSALQIGILWTAVNAMGMSSFNMAFSASKALKVLILAALLTRAFPHEHLWGVLFRRTLPALGKIALATAALGLVVWALAHALPHDPQRSRRGIVLLAAVAAAGGVVFIAAVHFLRVEEWHEALGWVKAKLRRR